MNEARLPSAYESGSFKSLDERFVGHPQVYQRLQEIADQLERAIVAGPTGDQAEEMTIEQVRKLGADDLRVLRANQPWPDYWQNVNCPSRSNAPPAGTLSKSL